MISLLRRPAVLASVVCVLLVVVLIGLFVAGGSDGDVETEAADSTSTTEPQASTSTSDVQSARRELSSPATETVASTTSLPSDADAGTTSVPESTTSTTPDPAPVRIPRPSCADGLGAPVAQLAPFTGLNASIPTGLPAVVVKVSNNNSSSRAALIGLDQADIVFEERIEATATRFAAVFHSQLPQNVGPVRSGRTTDIGILRNLGTPVLGYSGSNNGVAQQFREAAANGWFVPVINTDRAPFARDTRYSAPDNLFVDPTSLGACGNGGSPGPIFRYGQASSTTARQASRVSLDARSPYRFDWSGPDGWVRSQDGSPHITRTGESLAPANVVVLFVRYVPSAIDASSVDAETLGSGTAWIFRDGTITIGSWSRPAFAARYTLTDGAGVETTLAPGSTWVVLAPEGSASWS